MFTNKRLILPQIYYKNRKCRLPWEKNFAWPQVAPLKILVFYKVLAKMPKNASFMKKNFARGSPYTTKFQIFF